MLVGPWMVDDRSADPSETVLEFFVKSFFGKNRPVTASPPPAAACDGSDHTD